MIVFRILCAVFVAWAMNVAFSRPEAAALIEEMPEAAVVAPIAGAFVGFINLAKRQGWGMIVAVANGIWAGVLSILLTGLMIIVLKVIDTARIGDVDYEFLADRMSENVITLVDTGGTLGLLVICIGAGAIVGVLTELLHWAMVRLRRYRGVKERNNRRAHRPSMY